MDRPTVYLFDVDGTLITSGGAGRRAIERVFEELFGRADACTFSFGGMTNRAILRGGLTAIGEEASEERIDSLLPPYLEILVDEVSSAERYGVHAGIEAALHALSEVAGAAVGLGTGNVEPGARIKLDRVDLNDWFSFGGFGCDHEDRPTLIAAGAARGAEHLGIPVTGCRVVVIGDTVRDVSAAHANGAECVAVATGAGTEAQLRDAGAEHVFPDLSAPGALDALLGRP